jgi:hypothetical protein
LAPRDVPVPPAPPRAAVASPSSASPRALPTFPLASFPQAHLHSGRERGGRDVTHPWAGAAWARAVQGWAGAQLAQREETPPSSRHGSCACVTWGLCDAFAYPCLFTPTRRNWLASLHNSAPPSTLHTSEEIRNVTTNSSCRKSTDPPPIMRQRRGGGGGAWCGGVIGEPRVNEIIGKVRCEFVTGV